MLARRITWIALLTAAAVPVHAETPEELEARGDELAKDGRYLEAIDAFKAAGAAPHACRIALAYLRLERWAQAELWADACRAGQGPLPDWVPQLAQDLDAHLADSNAAPIELAVAPAGAVLHLAGTPADETFGARTVHLPPGRYTISARADGYVPVDRVIDVGDRAPQHVAIELHRPVVVPPPPPPPRADRRFVIAGAAVVGAGLVSYGAMAVAWSRLEDHRGFGGATETVYDVSRVATIALWAAGGGLIAYGLVHKTREAPAISAVPLPGGAFAAVTWSR